MDAQIHRSPCELRCFKYPICLLESLLCSLCSLPGKVFFKDEGGLFAKMRGADGCLQCRVPVVNVQYKFTAAPSVTA